MLKIHDIIVNGFHIRVQIGHNQLWFNDPLTSNWGDELKFVQPTLQYEKSLLLLLHISYRTEEPIWKWENYEQYRIELINRIKEMEAS